MRRESPLSLLRNGPLLALGVGHCVVDLCGNLLPVFYPLLVTALSLSYGSVAALTTVQSLFSSLSQPFFGWLADRFGSRWLASLSVLVAAFSVALVGFAPSYPALLLMVASLGLAVGGYHPQGAKAAAFLGGQWRTTSISIYIVLGNLGLASGPLLAATLLVPAGLRSTTALLAPGLLVGSLLLATMGRVDRLVMVKSKAAPSGGAVAIAWGGVAALVVTIAARSWVEYGLMAFLPLLYTARGEAPQVAGQTLFLLLMMGGAGTVLGGWLADLVGRRLVLVASFLLIAPTVHLFLGATGPEAMALALVVGLLVGCPLTVTLAAAQQILPSRMGVASGLAISLGMIVGGLGVGTLGLLADRFGLAPSLETLVPVALLAAVASLGVSKS